MRTKYFEYNGFNLRDRGFRVVSFNGQFSSIQTVTNGAEISLKTASVQGGSSNYFLGSSYKEVAVANFQIAKNKDAYDYDVSIAELPEISIEEYRDIVRWLGVKTPHEFSLDDSTYETSYHINSYWLGCFTKIAAITLGNKIYGLDLTFTSLSPHAFHRPLVNRKTVTVGSTMNIISKSDEEGYLYPTELTIEVLADGDLEIINSLEPDRKSIIKNCVAGEVITLNRPVVASSISSHKIQDNFNWAYPRIVTTMSNRLNKFSFNLPVTVKLVYTPLIKVGVSV